MSKEDIDQQSQESEAWQDKQIGSDFRGLIIDIRDRAQKNGHEDRGDQKKREDINRLDQKLFFLEFLLAFPIQRVINVNFKKVIDIHPEEVGELFEGRGIGQRKASFPLADRFVREAQAVGQLSLSQARFLTKTRDISGDDVFRFHILIIEQKRLLSSLYFLANGHFYQRSSAKAGKEAKNKVMKNETKENVWTGILSGIFASLYLACFIYGAYEYPHQVTSTSPLLVMLSALGGMILSFLPYLTKSLLKIKLAPLTNLFIQIFGLMGIGFGETLDCYYRFPFWDDVMHFLSGIWVSYLAYAFLYATMGEDHLSHRRAYLSFGALAVSLSVGLLWEVYEFSFDSFFGTDMQKTIPEGALFNGGNSFADLVGTDEEIASFFRSSKGYRYAIADTMSDLLECFGGSLLFQVILGFVIRKKPDFGRGLITLLPHKGKVGNNDPVSKPL
jgi:hypothetical protein